MKIPVLQPLALVRSETVSQLTEERLRQILAAVGRAIGKALGASGHGTVTVDFKNYEPKIELQNRDREPIEPEP